MCIDQKKNYLGQYTGSDNVNRDGRYFETNENLEVDEVEDFLENFLDSEFDTLADDGSVKEISQNCCKFNRLFRENKHDELQQILQSLPVSKVIQVVKDGSNQKVLPSASDKLSNGETSGEGHNTAMEVDEIDDGWQTITKDNRRH